MKCKLRIEELSVSSFSTEEDGPARRGTVRGMADTSPQFTFVYGSCVLARDTCDGSCQVIVRTCAQTCPATCAITCDDPSVCYQTCIPALCV
jgi:hypothetical protein